MKNQCSKTAEESTADNRALPSKMGFYSMPRQLGPQINSLITV